MDNQQNSRERALQSQTSYKKGTLKQFEGIVVTEFIKAHWAQLKSNGEFEIEKAELSEKWVEVVNFDPINPVHAMNADLPKLSTLKKYQGAETQQLAVMAVLTEIDDWFGDNGLSVPQHEMLAKRIIGEYYFYNPGEIKLAIRMGLQGSLSKVYGKINPSNIMDWLAEYDQIRAGEIENQTRQNQDHYSTAAPHPKFAEMWAKQVEKKLIDKTIYPSLVAYCNSVYKSYTELRGIIASECEKLIDKTDAGFDDFVNYVERRCLVDLNDKGVFDVAEIIKEIELNWQIAESFNVIDKIKVVQELKKETKENSLFRSMLGNLKTD